MESLFKKVGAGIENLSQEVGKQVEQALGAGSKSDSQQQDQGGSQNDTSSTTQSGHRFGSFAPQTSGNAKWYVDGASYFWAVSEALERKSSSSPQLGSGQT